MDYLIEFSSKVLFSLFGLVFSLFGIVVTLGIRTYSNFVKQTKEEFKDINEKINTINKTGSNADKQILVMTMSIQNFVDNLNRLEKRFEQFMDYTEKNSESRKQYHDHIEKISNNLLTQQQLMDILSRIEKMQK
jgi:predicted  nucleic acid-binding Zn-ribbon protein